MADGAIAKKSAISVIAKPLADDKLCKKVLKLAKKGAKRKQIKRGVKEVVKALRKNTQGICIIAGDISPIDVVTHLPVLCEDHDIPYIYVPSKEVQQSLLRAMFEAAVSNKTKLLNCVQELGAAGLTKRPTSCMLVLPKALKNATEDEESKEFLTSYDEVSKKVKAVQPVF